MNETLTAALGGGTKGTPGPETTEPDKTPAPASKGQKGTKLFTSTRKVVCPYSKVVITSSPTPVKMPLSNYLECQLEAGTIAEYTPPE